MSGYDFRFRNATDHYLMTTDAALYHKTRDDGKIFGNAECGGPLSEWGHSPLVCVSPRQ
jgi:hypothetical protein